MSTSIYEANANLHDLKIKIKINRIIDDSIVGFYREKSVKNRKSAKALEITIVYLKEEIQTKEQKQVLLP